MTPNRKNIDGTQYQIVEERLSTLYKLFREGEEGHFAQFYVQTGLMGECIIKGLESPNLPFKERKNIHDTIWSYLHNNVGYEYGSIQRVRKSPKLSVVTTRKSLSRYRVGAV